MSLFSVGHCDEITGSRGFEQVKNPNEGYKKTHFRPGMMQPDTFHRRTAVDANCNGQEIDPKFLINHAAKIPPENRTPETIAKIEEGLRFGIMDKSIISRSMFEDSIIRSSNYSIGADFPGYSNATVFFDKDKNNRAILLDSATGLSSIAAYFKDNTMYLYEFDAKSGKRKRFSAVPLNIPNAKIIKTMPIMQFANAAIIMHNRVAKLF